MYCEEPSVEPVPPAETMDTAVAPYEPAPVAPEPMPVAPFEPAPDQTYIRE